MIHPNPPITKHNIMAKKTKTTEKQINEMLETPAGASVPGNTPPRVDWPESTENRELGVTLSDEERIRHGLHLCDQLREAEALAEEKSATAKRYAAAIESKEKEIEETKDIFKTGKVRRNVPCQWKFQIHGLDAEGNGIYHSEMKTLVRDDTGEVVEVKPITQEDRQMNLGLDPEERLAANTATLTGRGYTVKPRPEDEAGDEPFVMVHGESGEETSIQADSIAEAVAKAVVQTEPAAGAEPETEPEAQMEPEAAEEAA